MHQALARSRPRAVATSAARAERPHHSVSPTILYRSRWYLNRDYNDARSPVMAPSLQLTRRGIVWDESQAARLIDEFQRLQSLVLPGFLEPALLERAQRGVEEAEFAEHHHELFVELSMRPHRSEERRVGK